MLGGEFSLMGVGPKVYIDEGYKANPNLFSAISWITQRVANTKWQLFDTTDNDEHIEIFDHPLLELLENPNPSQSKSEFLESACGYKKITGEAFIHGVSPEMGVNSGKPKELWILPTPIMTVKFDGSGIANKFLIESAGKSEDIPVDEILYIRQFNPGSANRGMSTIEAGKRVVTQSNDAYDANMKLLQNLGPQGLLTMDDAAANPTQEQIDLMEQKINRKYGGASNYGKAMVNSLNWKWQQIGLSAADLSLMESQKMSLRDICNLFNLNSQLFNDPDNTTYNNIQEARKAGITDAVIPEIEAFKNGLNSWLTPKYGENLKLGYDKNAFPELQKDLKSMAEWLSLAYWLTPNQKLEQMGFPQSDNPIMSEILLPTSVVPSGEPEELEKAYQRLNAIKDKQSNVA